MQRSIMESPPNWKYKKRHRKELSVEDIESIVAASKEPFQYHSVIAKRFRISELLVRTLIKEAKKQPEKLEAQRQRVQLDIDKRDAIEDVVTEILATDKDITSVRQI